jgi:hypothetical protein
VYAFLVTPMRVHASPISPPSVGRTRILLTYLVSRDVRLLQVQLCCTRVDHPAYITEVISLDTKFN